VYLRPHISLSSLSSFEKVMTKIILHSFYRAMHLSAERGLAIACRLSVRLSVTLVIFDHIGWKFWKLIARTISPTSSLFVARRRSLPKFLGVPPFSQKGVKLRTSNLAYTFTGPIRIRPLKFLEKRERGRIQGLPIFKGGYPLLSQKRVKLRTLNLASTFIGPI